METFSCSVKLLRAEEEQSIDATEFRKSIGCLRYLLHTRPDLAFCLGILSRYMHDPNTSHGAALKQVLRYLKGTLAWSCLQEKYKNRVKWLQRFEPQY